MHDPWHKPLVFLTRLLEVVFRVAAIVTLLWWVGVLFVFFVRGMRWAVGQ